jgi:hypothetical protein
MEEPLRFGPLSLCPQGCIPEPEPDFSAQAERFASRRYADQDLPELLPTTPRSRPA